MSACLVGLAWPAGAFDAPEAHHQVKRERHFLATFATSIDFPDRASLVLAVYGYPDPRLYGQEDYPDAPVRLTLYRRGEHVGLWQARTSSHALRELGFPEPVWREDAEAGLRAQGEAE
jgi:hypothetical protein